MPLWEQDLRNLRQDVTDYQLEPQGGNMQDEETIRNKLRAVSENVEYLEEKLKPLRSAPIYYQLLREQRAVLRWVLGEDGADT